jgi:hypothetical protein
MPTRNQRVLSPVAMHPGDENHQHSPFVIEGLAIEFRLVNRGAIGKASLENSGHILALMGVRPHPLGQATGRIIGDIFPDIGAAGYP